MKNCFIHNIRYILYSLEPFRLILTFILCIFYMVVGSNSYAISNATIIGCYADHETDIDKDSIYDFLTVDVGVNITVPGDYSLYGDLCDSHHHKLAWSASHRNLSAGYHVVSLDFNGVNIGKQGINGPYRIENLVLLSGSSDTYISICDEVLKTYITSPYNYSNFKALGQTSFANQYVVSGIGFGEIILTTTIKNKIPVFSGRYSNDIIGIKIPPVVFESITSNNSGYSYVLSGINIPGKPNDFTVTASEVNDLNIGLKKLQGSHENSNLVWKGEYSRTWITSQIQADKNGVATTTSNLLSPGIYDVKIFGDVAENVSQVNLTMTLIKKIIVNGRFNISIDTTGFPSGNYSITAKALNGSFSLDEIKLEGLSTGY